MQKKIRWLVGVMIFAVIIFLFVHIRDRKFFYEAPVNHNIDSVKLFYGNSYHTIFITDTLSFAGEPVPLSDSSVRKHLKYILATNSNWVPKAYNMLKYKSDVLDTLKKRLAISGVPTDFMYVACNESNFADITSSNGMCGIWQLEPNTARRFGLRVDSVVDERLSIARSTFAAANVIRYLHSLYGNWILSASAYNTGPGVTNYNLQYLKVKNMNDFFHNYYLSDYILHIIAFKIIFDNAATYLRST